MVQLDLLGFVLAVITAVIGGSVSVSANAPSRSKILKDLEILERMGRFKTTKDETAYMMMLRASIGKQLKNLVIPIWRYMLLAFAMLALMIAALFAAVFNLIPKELAVSPQVAILSLTVSPFIGYALGTVSANIVIAVLNRRIKTANEFMDTVLREVEDGMSESSEEHACSDEPAGEDSDVCEEIVHE